MDIMVTMQRADSPFGPYEASPHNPILSHRDNPDGSISCTGHADLEVDQNGTGGWFVWESGLLALRSEV